MDGHDLTAEISEVVGFLKLNNGCWVPGVFCVNIAEFIGNVGRVDCPWQITLGRYDEDVGIHLIGGGENPDIHRPIIRDDDAS